MPAAAINPEFIYKLWHDLTPAQLDDIETRLGYIPTGENNQDYSDLLNRYASEEIDLGILPGENGEIAGFVFFGFEEHAGGLDLIVFAAHASGSNENTGPVVELINGQLQTLARAKGCRMIAFRTVRPAMAKIFCGHGFYISEIILRKSLQ